MLYGEKGIVMYLHQIEKHRIHIIVNPKYEIYAHTKGDNQEIKETLEAHTNLCEKYFYEIFEKKGLEQIFLNFESILLPSFSAEAIALFREMLVNTVLLHDIGKVNVSFQKYKMKHDLKIKEARQYKDSHHSLLSAIFFIDIFLPKIKECYDSKINVSERNRLYQLMLLNAYIISRHHGQLNSMEAFEEKFDEGGAVDLLLGEFRVLFESTSVQSISITRKSIKKLFGLFDGTIGEPQEEFVTISLMIYTRLILSVLVSCDFYATSEFMNGVEIKDMGNLEDIDAFYNVYTSSSLYQSIAEYKKKKYGKTTDFSQEKEINVMRSELFLDAEKVFLENAQGNLFYLEAPTGSGKSNVALNLSLSMILKDKSKNKIFYVYPFNTLVEQNKRTLEDIFRNKDGESGLFHQIAVINSVVPMKNQLEIRVNEEEETRFYDYQKALLNHQFLNYPIILTTHVSLFRYLFGVEREELFPMHQLANSIVILDEIQSYKNSIWTELITFLSSYAKVLNIKVVIMSATLPDLDQLSLTKGGSIRLINNREKYYHHPLFRDRVQVDYSLLEHWGEIKKVLFHQVKEKSKLGKKILIEFVIKESAHDFYRALVEAEKNQEICCDIELMTGDDNMAERGRIIEKVKCSEDGIILVATQVVEAGIDIDMDIGYKNISIFDSEEQFLGRINRSCRKPQCVSYFFQLDDEKRLRKIYFGDERLNLVLSLKEESIRKMLVEKNFGAFYNEVFTRLRNTNENLNESNVKNFFKEQVGKLHFIHIQERMQLIKEDESQVSIFLNRIEYDTHGNVLDGKQIWSQYKKLLSSNRMDYAQKRVMLSRVKAQLNYFMYEVKYNENFTYNDRIGEIYFIEDGDKYFQNGKFDRKMFMSGIGDFI